MKIFMQTLYYLCILLIFLTSEWSNAEETSNYFLPKEFIVHKKLKKIFERCKSSDFNSTTMTLLGFKLLPKKNKRKIFVGFHNEIKGYAVKFFNNPHGKISEIDLFIKRIQGAELIRSYIEKNLLMDYFKVPKKWIWKIPNIKQMRYLLLVEDMDLLSSHANIKKWKKENFENTFLLNLYYIIKDVGLLDSLYIDNIPFSKDGKIAFIDTEHYSHKKIQFNILSYYLSEESKYKWEKISTRSH